MPKQKITKEMVVETAFQLAREGGMERVQVNPIAVRLGCSVQPIYSYCQNMDGLRRDVYARVRDFVHETLAQTDGSFQCSATRFLRISDKINEKKLLAFSRESHEHMQESICPSA